ncbi:MAG: hypothetical protein M3R36_01470 [Bacteroidota bacterium]|nr:hypothetical protein [Bacteroidota bacterium]
MIKKLRFLIKFKKNLSPNQHVNVIILVKNEFEEDWENLTLKEFFDGYGESDSIYDKL